MVSRVSPVLLSALLLPLASYYCQRLCCQRSPGPALISDQDSGQSGVPQLSCGSSIHWSVLHNVLWPPVTHVTSLSRTHLTRSRAPSSCVCPGWPPQMSGVTRCLMSASHRMVVTMSASGLTYVSSLWPRTRPRSDWAAPPGPAL